MFYKTQKNDACCDSSGAVKLRLRIDDDKKMKHEKREDEKRQMYNAGLALVFFMTSKRKCKQEVRWERKTKSVLHPLNQNVVTDTKGGAN